MTTVYYAMKEGAMLAFRQVMVVEDAAAARSRRQRPHRSQLRQRFHAIYVNHHWPGHFSLPFPLSLRARVGENSICHGRVQVSIERDMSDEAPYRAMGLRSVYAAHGSNGRFRISRALHLYFISHISLVGFLEFRQNHFAMRISSAIYTAAYWVSVGHISKSSASQ